MLPCKVIMSQTEARDQVYYLFREGASIANRSIARAGRWDHSR